MRRPSACTKLVLRLFRCEELPVTLVSFRDGEIVDAAAGASA
jgi:hypothetical protein